MKLRHSIPIRFESTHACCDSTKLRCALALATWLNGSYSRVRLRAHYGTPLLPFSN